MAAPRKIQWDTIAAVLGAAWVLSSLWGISSVNVFQNRDLTRAFLMTHGIPIFFGPEINAGGVLPGGFYYWLLAASLLAGGTWRAAWILMIGLGAVAIGWLWNFFARNFGRLAAFVACAALLWGPSFSAQIQEFWNPSYLPVFLVGILIGLAKAFATPDDERARARAWLWTCVGIGFTVQIHFMAIFLLIAACIIQTWPARLNLKALPGRTFARGLLAGSLPIAPYFLWLLSHPLRLGLTQEPPRYAEPYFSFFVHLAYLWDPGRGLRFHLLSDPRVLPSLFPPLLIGLGLLTAIARGRLTGARRSEGSPSSFQTGAAAVWAVCLAVSTVPIVLTLPYHHGFRYLELYSFALAFAAAAAVHRFWDPPFRSRAPLQGGALGTVALLALVFGPARVNTRHMTIYPEQSLSFDDFSAASRAIIERTGWSFDIAAQRLFYVNTSGTGPSKWIYGAVQARAPASPIPAEVPDGFFVLRPESERDRRAIAASARGWLLEQNLEISVSKALENHDLSVGEPVPVGSLFLIGYKVERPDRFPAHFRNFSEGFSERLSGDRETALLRERVTLNFNDCPDGNPVCAFRFSVANERNEHRLKLGLDGWILSQFLGSWAETVLNPYVGVQCESTGPVIRFPLAARVGLDQPLNGVILPPVEREVANPCGDRIFKISAGYSAGEVCNQNLNLELSARESSVNGF